MESSKQLLNYLNVSRYSQDTYIKHTVELQVHLLKNNS